MIKQAWICKCDMCGFIVEAPLKQVSVLEVTHNLPYAPDGWEQACDDEDNNIHICPECLQKLSEDSQ